MADDSAGFDTKLIFGILIFYTVLSAIITLIGTGNFEGKTPTFELPPIPLVQNTEDLEAQYAQKIQSGNNNPLEKFQAGFFYMLNHWTLGIGSTVYEIGDNVAQYGLYFMKLTFSFLGYIFKNVFAVFDNYFPPLIIIILFTYYDIKNYDWLIL